MGFEVQIEENREKNYSRNIVFFDRFFSSILVGFGEGFGRGLGGVLRFFLVTWVCICQFARTFLDFLQFWQQKLLKFTRCGGLEALKGCFGVHLGGTWLEKGWNFMVFSGEKVDWRRKKFNQGSNGARTGKKFSLRFPFSRCSGYGKRECAVPLGSGASPLGGVWGGRLRIELRTDFFWPKVGKSRKKSENVVKDRKRSEKVGKGSAPLIETCFSTVFFVDFGEVWGGFWEAKRVEKLIFLLVLGVCFLIP